MFGVSAPFVPCVRGMAMLFRDVAGAGGHGPINCADVPRGSLSRPDHAGTAGVILTPPLAPGPERDQEGARPHRSDRSSRSRRCSSARCAHRPYRTRQQLATSSGQPATICFSEFSARARSPYRPPRHSPQRSPHMGRCHDC